VHVTPSLPLLQGQCLWWQPRVTRCAGAVVVCRGSLCPVSVLPKQITVTEVLEWQRTTSHNIILNTRKSDEISTADAANEMVRPGPVL
jgi:hypothetical protein